jgi:ABC-type multidrug transport system ATPase subunit
MLVSIHTPEDLSGTADLLAFVADGHVLAAGPPQELLRHGRSAEIDRYLGL